MATTSILRLPFPSPNQDSWGDSFVAFAQAVDVGLAASKEDRNLFVLGGGTYSWFANGGGAGVGVLAWSGAWHVFAPSSGLLETLAPGSATLEEGQALVVRLVRRPQATPTLSASVQNRVDLDQSAGDPYILAVRYQDRLYLRGRSLADGETWDSEAETPELQGDAEGPLLDTRVVRLRGALLPPSADGTALAVGDALQVVAGANPRVVAQDGTHYWVAREGCADLVRVTIFSETGPRARVVMPDPTDTLIRFGLFWAGYLWVITNNGKLHKVDPVALRVVATYDSGVNTIRGMVVDGNGVIWIAYAGLALVKFVVATEAFGTVPLAEQPFSLLYAASYVWVGLTGSVLRVDPATAGTTPVAVSSPTDPVLYLQHEPTANKLWYTLFGTFVAEEIDVSTLTLGSNYALGAGTPTFGAVTSFFGVPTYCVAMSDSGYRVELLENLDTVPALGTPVSLPATGLPDSALSLGSSLVMAYLTEDVTQRLASPFVLGSPLPIGGKLGYAPAAPPVPAPTVTPVATATYSILTTDETLACDTLATAMTLTLPSGASVGQTFDICDVAGNANVNNILLNAPGGHTLDGGSGYRLANNYETVTVRFLGGTVWKVIL